MMLGLDERTKQVYEGDSYTGYGVLPLPVLSLATVIREEADFAALPVGCDLLTADLLFREDSFDGRDQVGGGRRDHSFALSGGRLVRPGGFESMS